MARAEEHENGSADRMVRAAEFGKLIVKLRWIGAEEEANALEEVLLRMAPEGFVILPDGETD